MTLLFSDDQVTVADSEDGTQISVHKSEKITFSSGIRIFNKQNKNNLF